MSIWSDMRRLLPTCRGTVIDVGCGAQPYRSLLPAGVRYMGLDAADAQAQFGYEVPDTTYFTGETWPVADASAETVLATETLEHVLRPAQFLLEAVRCLTPGGTLILTVPFSARWHFIPQDYWRFTPSSLRHLLCDAGFTDVAVYARGDELTVVCYKTVTLVLAWLLAADLGTFAGWFKRALAVVLLPLLGVAAALGQLSLMTSRGGDDCLGYTVVARRAFATDRDGAR